LSAQRILLCFQDGVEMVKKLFYKDVSSSNNSTFHDVLSSQLDCLANIGILLLLLSKSGGKINVEL
jgi:hypothetical protein